MNSLETVSYTHLDVYKRQGVAKEIAKESASNQLGGGAEVDGFNKMLTHIDATVEPKYMMYVIIFMSFVMLIALVVSTTRCV